MNAQKLNAAIEQVNAANDIPPATKQKLQTALNEAREPLPDTGVYRMVVGALGLVVVLTVIGAIVLAGMKNGTTEYKVPEGVIALASAAVGALAGLLAPSPRNG